MKLLADSFPLRFARRQQSFIAIAVAIYVAMWAVDRPAPIGATLLYSSCASDGRSRGSRA